MSDHVRLRRGIEVPAVPLNSVKRAIYGGLASSSGEMPGFFSKNLIKTN
jgi:hypothetical protein